GDLDVLSSNRYNYVWFKNEGGGSFGTEQPIGGEGKPAPFNARAADLDGDGDLDVLWASYDGFAGYLEIGWFENGGNGSFGAPQNIVAAGGSPPFVTAADLNNDGNLDLLWSGAENKIAWFEYDGNGGFGTEHIITAISNDALCVYAADLDNDGDHDVLSAYGNGVNVAWYENDGNGVFGGQKVISADADGAGTVSAADMDKDGDMDVLSASWNDNKIAWYENDGSGNFGSQKIIATDTVRPISIYVTDLDNDGDMDVLSASSNYPDYNEIAWYENDTQVWAHHVITTDAIGANAVFAADLDNDGAPDALSASWADGKLAWYKNDGAGNFGPQQIVSENTNGIDDVYAADMDNDGDTDILLASYNDNQVAWYKNDGNGNFGQATVASANQAIEVYAADLDNDGDQDVLSASYGDKITWYENDGGGSLGAKQIITTDVMYANSVYAADLDHDGDLDVLSASSEDGKIAWYDNLLGNVGVGDIQNPPIRFNLYPNPGGIHTHIQVAPNIKQGQAIDLRITNAQGKLVLAQSVLTANGSLLTLPHVPAGIYYVTLTMG
ncbi:MAG: T9SS type A sorting domain-containing protein, partial [Thermoanaerobaculia bacterium]|nr:T9SS type A sorting domain-containing protein [Thermoanaerobaculia bacterium]